MFRKPLPLGCWVLGIPLLIVVSLIKLTSYAYLLSSGVAAQGTIVDEQTISCGKSGAKHAFSVRFTDQAEQSHTSTISQCEYSSFDASPGDSVAIVYSPDDPTVIAPPRGLPFQYWFSLIFTILVSLTELVFLGFWIRKRIRKASLQRQQEQTESSANLGEGFPPG